MRRTSAPIAFVAAGLLAAAIVLAGCSGSGDSGSGDGDTATTFAGIGATTLPRSLTGGVDLRRLVVSNAPVGYDLLASPPFGAVTLQRLLADFSDAPAEDEDILEAAQFKGGFTRGWLRDSPKSFLGIFVFEFAEEEGARSARDRFALQNETEKNASRFPVEGITDAVGMSYVRQAEGERPSEQVHIVTFVRGARLYQVTGQFPGDQASPEETVAFARIEDQIAA